MARKYVNPNRAVPDRPADLADLLSDADFPFSVAVTGEMLAAYARKAIARDPGLGEQVRAQPGPGAGLLRRAGSAVAAAAWNGALPAAGLDGEFAGLGEFAAAVRHKTGALARVREIQNSYGTEIPESGGFLLPESRRAIHHREPQDGRARDRQVPRRRERPDPRCLPLLQQQRRRQARAPALTCPYIGFLKAASPWDPRRRQSFGQATLSFHF